jgi:hypothetical protein
MGTTSITKSAVKHLSASFAFNFPVQKTQGDSQREPNNRSDDACFVTSQFTITGRRAADRPNRPNFCPRETRVRDVFLKGTEAEHILSFPGHVPRIANRPSQDDSAEEGTRFLQP